MRLAFLFMLLCALFAVKTDNTLEMIGCASILFACIRPDLLDTGGKMESPSLSLSYFGQTLLFICFVPGLPFILLDIFFDIPTTTESILFYVVGPPVLVITLGILFSLYHTNKKEKQND